MHSFRPRHRTLGLTGPVMLAAMLVSLCGVQPLLAASTDLTITIDEAKLVRLDRPAADIVVGNPSIADVAVQSSKVLVVTGKSFGRTNLIVIDADGKEITSKILSVQEPRAGLVTLYRGTDRYTAYCAPNCAAALEIGDSPGHFDDVAKQIKDKQAISQSTAEGGRASE